MSFDPASIPAELRLRRDAHAAWAENAGLNATRVLEESWLDGWLLRGADSAAKRLRSVQAIAPGVVPFDEKLARCAAVYADWGLPLLFRVTPFSQPDGLDEALAQRGFVAFDPIRVMTAAIDGQAHGGSDAAIVAVSQAEYAALAGELEGDTPERVEAAIVRATLQPLDGIFLALREEAYLISVGSIVFDGPLAGIYGLRTRAALRGQGYGRRMMTALLAHAGACDRRQACLQVGAENDAARALYARFGFSDCHAYWYRRPAD